MQFPACVMQSQGDSIRSPRRAGISLFRTRFFKHEGRYMSVIENADELPAEREGRQGLFIPPLGNSSPFSMDMQSTHYRHLFFVVKTIIRR